MVYINPDRSPKIGKSMLTTKSISVNNITLKQQNKELTITTKGNWKGTLQELQSLLKDLYDKN
jgi:hypothetical protein